MKRAGYDRLIAARAIVTTPSSIGWRNTSSTFLRNSGNSSRNNTPPCARLTSPGRGYEPPPIRPASEIVWCGARNGRRATSDSPSGRVPATGWVFVVSSASSRLIGGRIVGSLRQVFARQHQRFQSGGARREGHGKRAPHRPDRAFEPELAQDDHAPQALARDLLGGGKDAHGDRQVERRAFLADVGRGEVHGNALQGEGVTLEPRPGR